MTEGSRNILWIEESDKVTYEEDILTGLGVPFTTTLELEGQANRVRAGEYTAVVFNITAAYCFLDDTWRRSSGDDVEIFDPIRDFVSAIRTAKKDGSLEHVITVGDFQGVDNAYDLGPDEFPRENVPYSITNFLDLLEISYTERDL